MNEELNKEAEEYVMKKYSNEPKFIQQFRIIDYINGATTSKHVEREKIRAQIDENESILTMAKIHMDERAVLVLKQRIFNLQTKLEAI